jgi:hypothetical protein
MAMKMSRRPRGEKDEYVLCKHLGRLIRVSITRILEHAGEMLGPTKKAVTLFQ